MSHFEQCNHTKFGAVEDVKKRYENLTENGLAAKTCKIRITLNLLKSLIS